MTKENYIKICPKCESTDIAINTDMFTGQGGAFFSDYCKNCNYGYPYGSFFPEIEESEVETFRKELKEKK
jgi:hypothetical protein